MITLSKYTRPLAPGPALKGKPRTGAFNRCRRRRSRRRHSPHPHDHDHHPRHTGPTSRAEGLRPPARRARLLATRLNCLNSCNTIVVTPQVCGTHAQALCAVPTVRICFIFPSPERPRRGTWLRTNAPAPAIASLGWFVRFRQRRPPRADRCAGRPGPGVERALHPRHRQTPPPPFRIEGGGCHLEFPRKDYLSATFGAW